MMMNPTFYKSIHEESVTMSQRGRGIILINGLARHSVKLIVCVILTILLFTSFLLMKTDASSEILTAAANEQTVVVASGDTLWGIAARFTDSRDDIQYSIYQIKERNQLNSVDLKPGQLLIIPN
ncbi:MAG: LysM peptidoglycan-binding domain-containing protein [Candidatus Pristimantibacillus sp.]